MSVGGGKSESASSNFSHGLNQSYIDPLQKKYLAGLWGAASEGILGQGLGAISPQLQQQFLGMLQNNPMMQSAMEFANPNNQMVQNNISMLQKNLQDQYENVFMPQVTDAAIQTGQLGGGRQGVAQGLGMQGFQRALSEGSQNIMNNAYGQAQQASQFGAGLYNQMGMQGLQGLGMMQNQAYAPLLALAQILGNPTVVSKGSQLGYGNQSSNNWNMTAGLLPPMR